MIFSGIVIGDSNYVCFKAVGKVVVSTYSIKYDLVCITDEETDSNGPKQSLKILQVGPGRIISRHVSFILTQKL